MNQHKAADGTEFVYIDGKRWTVPAGSNVWPAPDAAEREPSHVGGNMPGCSFCEQGMEPWGDTPNPR